MANPGPILYDTKKDSNLIFDIGMHKGEDSEFYLKKGFRVVAFEANPDLVEDCRKRLGQYVDSGQLTIVGGAIVEGDQIAAGQKKVRFYRNETHSVWGTVSADWSKRNERLGTASTLIEVDAVDFGQMLRRFGVPRYMKIDIEGADMICVRALAQFRERPDFVSIESDKESLANIKKEIETFTNLGYDSFKAVEQSELAQRQRPPNPPREGRSVEHQFQEGSSGLFGLELDGDWRSGPEIIQQYKRILFAYHLLGDDGVFKKWKFRGAGRLRSLLSKVLSRIANAPIPGWYDTHARHASAK